MSELTQRKDQLLNQLINYLSYLLQYHCCGTGKCLLYCKYILILLHGMLQGYCTRSSLRPISFSRAKKIRIDGIWITLFTNMTLKRSGRKQGQNKLENFAQNLQKMWTHYAVRKTKRDEGPKHVCDGKFRHPHIDSAARSMWMPEFSDSSMCVTEFSVTYSTCFGPASRLVFLKVYVQ
jgi:hypothetical protein